MEYVPEYTEKTLATFARWRELYKKIMDARNKEIADGFDPCTITRCKECQRECAAGPFEEILVALVALSDSMADPIGMPDKYVNETATMMERLMDIYEEVMGK